MNKPVEAEQFSRTVADLLIRDGRVTQADLDHAGELSARTSQPMRVVLDRLGLVSQGDWATASAEACGLPLVNLDDLPETLPQDERLSLNYLRRNNIAPIALGDDSAVFAVADPEHEATISALRMTYGSGLDLRVATDRDIEAAFARSEAAASENQARVVTLGSGSQNQTDYLLELANNAPTIKYVEKLLATAIEKRATDIHLEPLDAKVRARLRVDGILVETDGPTPDLFAGVVSRLKILASLDIAERRLPQDGNIRHKSHGRTIDIRMATAPTLYGESITLRLLDGRSNLGTLDALQMPNDVRTIYKKALGEPNGLILVTGPTGSGKTTTLHAALSGLNDIGRKIVTIENPVEIRRPGLVQIEVNPGLGWTFAAALRTILRHDPDVLMVGEIRDAETAELAVRAALTGHLVLSTLHTNRAAEAITRLGNMGVPDYLLGSVVRMAAAQRLVRTLCPDCAKPARLTPGNKTYETYSRLSKLDPALGPVESWSLRVPKGCDACNQQGFLGRTALFEALAAEQVMQTAAGKKASNYRSMGLAGLGLIAEGKTTLSELIRVVGAPSAWG